MSINHFFSVSAVIDFFSKAYLLHTKSQEISETCICFDTAILSLVIYPKEMIKNVHKDLCI